MKLLDLRTNLLRGQDAEGPPYSVYTVGTEEQGPMTRSSGFSAHQLFLTASGKGRFRELGQSKWDIVDAGSVLFVPAHVPHEYVSEGYEPWKVGYVSFSASAEALRVWSLGDAPALLPIERTDRPFWLLARIWEASGAEQDDWAAAEQLLRFFAEIGKQRASRAPRRQDGRKADAVGPNAVVHAASLFLQDHLNRRATTITDLAGRMGYSRKQLTRLFLGAYGTTPLQYLKRLRLRTAARLLLDQPERTVAGVADQVGMEAVYFARAFREEFGVPPSEYRDSGRTIDWE